jgi:hypothetical protein
MATAREIMPAAEIATGDADARSANADRIESTLNHLTKQLDWKTSFLTNELL